ncbi:MAG: hypothetical protein NTZ59_15720 [Bacteroidetes bacterium]|nr:hypothetical protein [Bacteroidota bacterium]
MLILATTTDKIQVLLTSAITTNQLDCIATYKDISTTAYSGSSPTLVTTNNTTAVDLVPAPASNVQRIVDFISVYNADTANATVTVRINRNSSTGVLFRCTLATNELLLYVEGKGWNIHSSSGLSKQSLTYDNSNISSNPNYLINGGFQISQAATSATITAGTATPTASLGYQTVDSWFAYSVGGNPTIAQVAGSGATPNRLQLTGAASITSVGIGQRLEAINTTSLALKTVTLSFECSNSLLTSLTVVANRPTTTANTFGTIGTPTKTLINSTNVTINSTLTRYSVTFTCPQDVDKGLEILFVLGAQTSGTFVLSNVKLEEGSVSTTYVSSDFVSELTRSQRYFVAATLLVGQATTQTWVSSYTFPSTMRTTPIRIGGGSGYAVALLNSFGIAHYQSIAASLAFTFSAYIP